MSEMHAETISHYLVDMEVSSEYKFTLGDTFELPAGLPERIRELAVRYPGVRRTIAEFGITVLHYLDARELRSDKGKDS